MSSVAHSPEPWTVSRSGVSVDAGNVRIRQEAGAPREELAANARRIAACVNACAGIATCDLESISALPDYLRLLKLSYLADRNASVMEGAPVDPYVAAGDGR